jgi:hypothetical protein
VLWLRSPSRISPAMILPSETGGANFADIRVSSGQNYRPSSLFAVRSELLTGGQAE